MMNKLIIAIDCDDVLVPGVEDLINAYNQRHNTAVRLENAYLIDHPEWEAERTEAYKRLRDIHLSDDYVHSTPHPTTQEVVRRLAQSHELHLVTAREPELERATLSMIDEFFPGCFVGIEHTGGRIPKGDVCTMIGADMLIDDGLHNLIKAKEYGVAWLVRFGSYPWQRENDLELLSEAISCANWVEVEQEIERIARLQLAG